jgi:hypothetical protein
VIDSADGTDTTITITIHGADETPVDQDFDDSIGGSTVTTPDPDLVLATAGDDDISGLNGNDIMYGGAGNDTFNGNQLEDVLYGGSGNDRLDGDTGNDQLYGASGDDRIDGSEGVDHLYGGSGNDTLDGGNENDFIFGGAGNDRPPVCPGLVGPISCSRTVGILGRIVDPPRRLIRCLLKTKRSAGRCGACCTKATHYDNRYFTLEPLIRNMYLFLRTRQRRPRCPLCLHPTRQRLPSLPLWPRATPLDPLPVPGRRPRSRRARRWRGKRPPRTRPPAAPTLRSTA